MRVQLLIRDKEYQDALTEMIAGSDMDILIEIKSESSRDGKSIILTDISPDELDRDVLCKISPRTLFLSAVRPGNDAGRKVSGEISAPLHIVFKYSCISNILAELALVHHEWTGDPGNISTVSRTIAVIGESDYHSADRCRILARQIVYRKGGSVLILPLGYINDYSYDTGEARGWFTRLMYMIDEGKDYPADSFVCKDSYGVSYLMLPRGLNPVSGLGNAYLGKLIMSLGCRFDTLILDAGTSFRRENIDLAARSDRILYFGSGRRIPDITKIIGSEAADRLTTISISADQDETISIDEFVMQICGS